MNTTPVRVGAALGRPLYRTLGPLGLAFIALSGYDSALAQLNQNCTVSILNRTAQVDTNGNWLIDNIPFGPIAVRAHAVCVQNGQTTFGKTAAYAVSSGQTTGFDSNITMGATDFTPAGIRITAPSTTLNQVAQPRNSRSPRPSPPDRPKM